MAKSTSQAKHELAVAVEDAKKAIANAASEALKVSSLKTSEDHDTLIRIETKLQQVICDVNEIKTNTVTRIDKIEIDYVTKIEHEKVIDDIVMLKNWKNWLIGSSSVIIALGTFLSVTLFNHLIGK